MYEAWSRSARKNRLWSPGDKVWPWDEIGDKQRQCWIDTAEAAAKMLADAVAVA